ncbi:glycosyltransferase [Haloarcula sp. S1AR25-5A]|uniref:Glycosyltransferase n=1 Tax=Haloarcula terrestris TaxID=2950533 RepID=A0AAE4F0X8_9EURY|nr:glycosyltransferase [Haloarcula terrestris]MDS0223823.1 glycosyltransferase [Haloarcula terrestris]
MDLDVGFVPVGRPGHGGPGSVQTSSLLIREMSKYFNLTIYVISNESVERDHLPAKERVDYVIRDGLNITPHPLHNKMKEVSSLIPQLKSHDLIHSYCSEYIKQLSVIDTPTLVTLNSYRPICPKEDLRYLNKKKCSGPSMTKCISCVTRSAVDRSQGFKGELKSYYTSIYQLNLSRETIESKRDITSYHALSPHLKQDYESLGFPGTSIKVIPHFYNEQFYQPKQSANINQKSPTILSVGRLEEKKGVQTLIESIPKMKSMGYQPSVKIVGDGSYERKLHSLAESLNVEQEIEWLGFVDYNELPDIYSSSDLFVYPGLWDEPFGRVFLEALASQLPIVASNVGSVEYIIGDAGRTFVPGVSEDLASKFDSLIQDYEYHYNSIGDELSRFKRERIIDKFRKHYRKVATH